jgi:hypothetical protein
MEDGLGAVDVLDETLHATGKGEEFFFAGALIDQLDGDAVVQEGKLAQAFGGFRSEFDVTENFVIRQEMNLRAALFGIAQNLEWRDFKAVTHFDAAVNRHTAAKFHEMLLAIATNGQAQEFGQCIDAGNADAVQPPDTL